MVSASRLDADLVLDNKMDILTESLLITIYRPERDDADYN